MEPPAARSRPAAARLASRRRLLADPLRIAQACANLVGNAAEHGGGVVRVRVRARATVRIEVADDGPGLPVSVAALTAAARARRGRRGHGLAIAAAIAEHHGGRLAAAPSDGGARLMLEMPAARAGRRVTRRRRAAVLLGLALVLGTLSATHMARREAALEAQLGPVARSSSRATTCPPGGRSSSSDLGVRSLPARYAPPGEPAFAAALAGQSSRCRSPPARR